MLQSGTKSSHMKSHPALCCSGFILLVTLLAIWSCDSSSRKSSRKKSESDLLFAEQLKNRGSYDSAIIYFRKAADYHLKQNQYPEWTNSVTGVIDCFRVKGDLDTALNLVDQAMRIAITKMDTTDNLYNGLVHKKALLYSDKRQFAEASALFNRNITIYKAKSAIPDTAISMKH